MKLEDILRKAKRSIVIPLTLLTSALAINSANAQFRQVSGNVTSVPSNEAQFAQIVFTNKNTLDSTIVYTDSVTGDYNTTLPAAPYKQEVRVNDNYKYLDENFTVTNNRVDSIETVEKFNTQSNIHPNGMLLMRILTGTDPGSPNTIIAPWKLQDRPIKIFTDSTNTPNQGWRDSYEFAVNDIQTKFNIQELYQEVAAAPDIGIQVHWVDQTPTPGLLGETLITSTYPDGSPKIAEIYINKNFPANNSTMLREMMRALRFQSFSQDPQMIMYYSGATSGQLHPGEGKSGERKYKFKHVPKDMTPYDTSLAKIIITSIEEENTPKPLEYKLLQNYPNPFNNQTKIKFSIPEPSEVNIEIYDPLGRKILETKKEELMTGTYEETIKMPNNASGTYYYRLKASNKNGLHIKTGKMVYQK
jgi:hypothetical protein